MRKHIPHPVTRLYSPYAELDLIHGGNEATAIEESLKIAVDLRELLKDGEKILYVNTLVSDLRLAFAMGKRFDHGARRDRNFFVTYCSGEIIEKLPVLRYMAENKNYKYLVINGFELAAHNSRHRNEFMAWLRMMRNIGINIILFTSTKPNHYGTLGALRYSARTVAEVGAYLAKANDQQWTDREKTNTVTMNTEAPVEDVVVSEVETVEEDTIKEGTNKEETNKEVITAENTTEIESSEEELEFADAPDATKLYTETSIEPKPHTATILQYSDSESLKTKDLALEYA